MNLRRVILVLSFVFLALTSCADTHFFNPPGFQEFIQEARGKYPYFRDITCSATQPNALYYDLFLNEYKTIEEMDDFLNELKSYVTRQDVLEWFDQNERKLLDSLLEEHDGNGSPFVIGLSYGTSEKGFVFITEQDSRYREWEISFRAD